MNNEILTKLAEVLEDQAYYWDLQCGNDSHVERLQKEARVIRTMLRAQQCKKYIG